MLTIIFVLKIISYRSIGDSEISRQKTMRKSFFFSALILLAATGTHAQDVNTQSCEKGNGQACYLAAIEMHKAKNFGRGADLAQKACDLNYAQGCFYLGKLCKIRNFSQSPFGGFIFEESDGNFPSGRN